MENNCGVYHILNTLNNKRYIGSSVRLSERKNKHFKLLRDNKHHSPYLQNAYNKYGEENFIFEILEYVEVKEQVIGFEQYYIDYFGYETLYNVCPKAGSKLGIKLTEEQKKKYKGLNKGIKHPPRTEEHKLKISLAHKGKSLSEEHKSKLSLALKGNTRSLGYKHSKEHCERHSIRMKGVNKGRKQKPLTPEQLKRLSAALPKKRVYCFNLNFEFLETYESAELASKELDLDPSSVCKCCKLKLKRVKNYIFTYTPTIENKEFYRHLCDISVIKYNELGEVLKEYSSIKEAAKENNIGQATVKRGCEKKITVKQNLIFRYK